MENMEQNNYRIDFIIKEEPLHIPFGSYNNYALLADKELEDFVIYLIKKCVNAKALMDDNECALFAKNIHLYKNDEKCAICSIEERSIQVYP